MNFTGNAKRTDQRSDDCSIFTPETVSKFGFNPTCFFQSSQPKILIIRLGFSFSLRPQHTLLLKEGKILGFYSGSPVTGSAIVRPPADTVVPQFTIEGPNTVGSCSESFIRVFAAGKNLKIEWNVTLSKDSSVISKAEVTSDIENLRLRLSSLGKSLRLVKLNQNEIVAGFIYNFSVVVTNFLGISSFKNFQVERKASDLPSLNLGRKDRTLQVSQDLNLFGSVTLSPCQALQDVTTSYRWDIDQDKIVLHGRSLNRSKLFIPARQLSAGKTYVFTLIVSSSGSFNVQGTTTVLVEGSPLLIEINGGDRLVSNTMPLTLSSVYYDPDDTADQNSFAWVCNECPSGVTLALKSRIDINISNFITGIR